MKNLITLLVLALAINACGSGNKISQESSATSEKMEPSPNYVESYLSIKDALVETDQKKAAEAAQSFLDLSEDQQLNASLKLIAGSKDVASQREAFETLSMNMYEIIQANNGEMVLYKQYCPMAFKNKGAYWLAAEKEVNNPYFGDMMLHCGSVQETINQ